MAQALDGYFREIAAQAAQAVAAQTPPPDQPIPVSDGPQTAMASAWTALSVHPLSVLETEYVGLVHEAEARGGDEAAFEAMSRYFTLTSSEPARLLPETPALIDERIKDLRACLELAMDMAGHEPQGAYALLRSIVGDTAALINLMTRAETLAFSGAGLQKAVAYLGGFPLDPDETARQWGARHPVSSAGPSSEQVLAWAEALQAELLTPICAHDNALASLRGLYNIAPFYLYRLMHRFQGGSQAAPMDLVSKGIASGATTKAIHDPALTWLTEWHETQMVRLKTQIRALDGRLKAQFRCEGDVLRFFVKGGRALYTALGQPHLGENDWDTGILINPALAPRDWYAAFGAVNDLVLGFLDQARFDYSALMRRHEGALGALPAQMLRATRGDSDANLYSRLGLLAEHQFETAAFGTDVQPAGARLAAFQRVRRGGVNGELIDIGISKRHSVELAEHWHDVTIAEKQGVSQAGIPVPDLPYFIDDFSTIIREALAAKTADRKLAKRLLRLKLVLESADPLLRQKVRGFARMVRQTLPEGAAAFGVGEEGAAARLSAWVLGGFLASLPDLWCRKHWAKALDDLLRSRAAEILNDPEMEAIWQKVVPALPDADQRECRAILAILNAAGILAETYGADEVRLATLIGDGERTNPLGLALAQALASILALNSKPEADLFYLSGLHAMRFQAEQAGEGADFPLKFCVDGRLELLWRAGDRGRLTALPELAERLNQILDAGPLRAEYISEGPGQAVVVFATNPSEGLTISTEKTVLMTIQPEQNASTHAVDYIARRPLALCRDLVALFTARAAQSPDFAFRLRRKACADFVLNSLMGRQIR